MVIPHKRRPLFISSACVLAVLFIGAAYVSSGPSFLSARTVGAESTHDLLVSYASKDTDSDGLPDWQEVLYATDPANAHSVSPTLTDGEAVSQGLVEPKFKTAALTSADASSIPGPEAGPQTLTDQFAKELFGQYLKARGSGQPSSNDVATFVEQGVNELKQNQVQPDTFNQGQVRVSGAGPDALLSYAATVETILAKTDAGRNPTEIEYFSSAVHTGDAKALAGVKKYATAYSTASRALMNVTVPRELGSSHLKLANALARVSTSLSDMSELNADPIRAMLGMSTYSDNSALTLRALGEMNAVYRAEHVEPAVGVAGSSFYQFTFLGVQK